MLRFTIFKICSSYLIRSLKGSFMSRLSQLMCNVNMLTYKTVVSFLCVWIKPQTSKACSLMLLRWTEIITVYLICYYFFPAAFPKLKFPKTSFTSFFLPRYRFSSSSRGIIIDYHSLSFLFESFQGSPVSCLLP